MFSCERTSKIRYELGRGVVDDGVDVGESGESEDFDCFVVCMIREWPRYTINEWSVWEKRRMTHD